MQTFLELSLANFCQTFFTKHQSSLRNITYSSFSIAGFYMTITIFEALKIITTQSFIHSGFNKNIWEHLLTHNRRISHIKTINKHNPKKKKIYLINLLVIRQYNCMIQIHINYRSYTIMFRKYPIVFRITHNVLISMSTNCWQYM